MFYIGLLIFMCVLGQSNKFDPVIQQDEVCPACSLRNSLEETVNLMRQSKLEFFEFF